MSKDSPPSPEISTSAQETRISKDLPGALNQFIGTGEHAKTSIVYQGIKWLILGGLVLTGLILILGFFDTTNRINPEIIFELWQYLSPLILALLGYIFGKGRE